MHHINGVTVYPAGQVIPDQQTSDGRIPGIDGMLDQIAGAVVRQAAPVLRDEILPILQRDRELQRTIGMAAGERAAAELRPYAVVATVALATIAATFLWRSYRESKR